MQEPEKLLRNVSFVTLKTRSEERCDFRDNFNSLISLQDAVIEKIRLKNVTLKVQKNKLHQQLKQKEEMGEVLHAIDFDQLQIENKQYLLKIEERNAELLKLKMTAGNTIQILNSHKVTFPTLLIGLKHCRNDYLIFPKNQKD